MDRKRIGIGSVSDRYRIRIGLEADWDRIGIRSESDRNRIGIGFESDQNRIRIRSESKRNWTGIETELEWDPPSHLLPIRPLHVKELDVLIPVDSNIQGR